MVLGGGGNCGEGVGDETPKMAVPWRGGLRLISHNLNPVLPVFSKLKNSVFNYFFYNIMVQIQRGGDGVVQPSLGPPGLTTAVFSV